jgi:fumarylacetoacetase
MPIKPRRPHARYGKQHLPSGEKRGFIEDGDEIIFRGFCEKPGYARIGFGECRAVLASAG